MPAASFKDLFSKQAEVYAQARPKYPEELFSFLAGLCENNHLVWDCATGNGQAAISLTKYFEKIIATDASEQQLAQAKHLPKITYHKALAEESSLENESVDLITVATAAHWFDLPKFYEEVNRVLKPGGILAVWCYGPVLYINEAIEKLLKFLNDDILAEYAAPGFNYVRNRYENLPFPYPEVESPQFYSVEKWKLSQLTGFIDSWSMTQKYLQVKGAHPIEKILPELMRAWPNADETKEVRFPLFMKVGRKPGN